MAQRTREPHQTTEVSGSYKEKRMIYRIVEIKKTHDKGKGGRPRIPSTT
jgi:hypothetical protein